MSAFLASQMPLSGWADQQLAMLATASDPSAFSGLSGAGLLAERAVINGYKVPATKSAGGGCTIYPTRDGAIALNLSRQDDRDLLPALLQIDCSGLSELDAARHIADSKSAALVAQGRILGMAIADVHERRETASPAIDAKSSTRHPVRKKRPLRVLDLSALWAGPLAGRLLALAGAEVTKIECIGRPDSMRHSDPVLFDRLNGNKQHLRLDFGTDAGLDALHAIIAGSDIVIEAARPRALRQLGIDADRLVAQNPGLIWLTITGHGVCGEAANWIGFGDDAAVAGGLSAAMEKVVGKIGFVGDAIADPLTGIVAARVGWQAWHAGKGGRTIFSMSGIVAQVVAEETARNPQGFATTLQNWADAAGTPIVG